MGLLDILKLTKIVKRKGAGATLYPDKIVIETVDQIKNSYGVNTTNVTLLDVNVDNEILGKTLRYHLDQSRDDLRADDPTVPYNEYLKAAGFKTSKEYYKNARHQMVGQREGKIVLEPTINGGPTGKNKGFSGTTEKSITVDETITDKELGDMLRLGWSKCILPNEIIA